MPSKRAKKVSIDAANSSELVTEHPNNIKERAVENIESKEDNPKERRVTQISQLEHAKRKSMWVGSKKIQTTEMYCISSDRQLFELKQIKFAPAWYKIVDEIVVNAIDQWVNYPKKVDRINIDFNRETGVISILNTGPSIGIYMTQNLNGEKMYAPQLIASEFLSGDNLDDNDENRVTGGTNGAGLKLTNAFSDFLTIVTSDKKKHYSQTFRERLTIIEPPIITNIGKLIGNPVAKGKSKKEKPEKEKPEYKEGGSGKSESGKSESGKSESGKSESGKSESGKNAKQEAESFTQIIFLPSYYVFGYDTGYQSEMADDLENLIISRSYQAAAFTTAAIYYNNNKIEIPSTNAESNKKKPNIFYNFAKMFIGNNEMWGTRVTSTDPKYEKFPWDICVGVSDGKFRQVSLINGIYVYDGGTHIKHIQNQIVANLKNNVEKLIKKSKTKFNANYIVNNLFIFFSGSIVKPEFSSQIKSILGDPIEKFESYVFKKKDYTDLWHILEPHIMSLFLDKYKDKKKNRVNRSAINVPKCTDAKYAGHKTKYANCTLVVCEGDSAMGTVHEGITNKSTKLSYDYYGTFSIQGVPMNARKEVSKYEDSVTKKTTLIRNAKLQKNERLSSLVKVLGLDYEKSYELNAHGDEEFSTLRYAKITAAVDQDDDGKGNIFGLLINFFILFWPALATRGFITRFNTPIIRAYPKNKNKFVEEFESLKTYAEWVTKIYKGDDEKVLSDFTLKYYKGLGSHKKNEIPQMFKNFESRLCVYRLDPEALQKLEAYFGPDTDLRKVALSTPVTREETIGKIIDITEQLERDLKAYQRDNIMRKLPHSIDGSVPSRRKVIYTARSVFGSSNAEMKVNAFVNETSKTTHYHHGESSLAGTVTKMAQEFPGARHLPFLRPQGQFGTRSNGGKDSADPRYTFTQLNKQLCFAMFPKDDDFLLKYIFDDGERCEPEYYVPVIPLSILEHMELPATGWKVKIWARDYREVIANVRALIKDKLKKAKPMGVWLKDNKGTLRTYKGREYSVGSYEYDEDKNIIIVTELPLGKFSAPFIGDYASGDEGQLCNKPYFKSKPDDMTNDDGVNITFYLTETGWKEINEKYGNDTFDCVEDLMNLRTSLDDNINMIAVDGTVKEFENYEKVIDDWFPVRKQLYADRIERHIILTNLMIEYLKNIIRFTQSHQKYNITPKTTMEVVDEILTKNKYDTFNASLLHNPKYTEIGELSKLIINNISAGTSYEYLIKLSYRDMIECACKKREKHLADLEDKLKDLALDDGTADIFKGGKTWLRELDELERVIEDGIELGWSYGKDVAKFR